MDHPHRLLGQRQQLGGLAADRVGRLRSPTRSSACCRRIPPPRRTARSRHAAGRARYRWPTARSRHWRAPSGCRPPRARSAACSDARAGPARAWRNPASPDHGFHSALSSRAARTAFSSRSATTPRKSSIRTTLTMPGMCRTELMSTVEQARADRSLRAGRRRPDHAAMQHAGPTHVVHEGEAAGGLGRNIAARHRFADHGIFRGLLGARRGRTARRSNRLSPISSP